jgi:Co/Zn/Cd efflux system component
MADRTAAESGGSLRSVLILVASLNFAYFAVEALVAWWIASVSLFADSMDFLEDATLTLLVLWALGRTLRLQATIAFGLAAIIAAPGFAALWVAYQKWLHPTTPDAQALTLTALGALAVNAFCALALVRIKGRRGSLVRAVYLSARNDVLGNIAIIAAGVATAYTASFWPDFIVGLAVFALHAGAALEVYTTARAEWKSAAS